MKVFFRFFRDYPRESILAPLFKLLEACFDLLVPIVVAQIIDAASGAGRVTGSSGAARACWYCLPLWG